MASTAQLASMVSEPVRCVLGGLVWLKQPDSQPKHGTSTEYQRDACVGSLAMYMPPSAPEEQDAPAGRNAQAGKDQCQPDRVPEFERLEFQLDRPLERASS